MSQLLACPFCRELFDRAEADHCPECDIALQPLHRLPPSHAAMEEDAARWERTRPEDERLAFGAVGRGRGALLAVAIASLLVFWFTPWVSVSAPYSEVRSGHSLARGPLGFLWGGAAAWLMSIALVLSRRSIRQMRGTRVILMLFAAMTGSEVAVLLALSPSHVRDLPIAYEWRWGLYSALVLSGVGVALGARFGGALPPDETGRPSRAPDPAPTVH